MLDFIGMEVSRTNLDAVKIILDTADRKKHLLVLIVRLYIVGCIDFVLAYNVPF